MLLQLGQRTTRTDVVDLLAECHARIRRFLELAGRLADTPDVPADEARGVAQQVHRYFTSSFLHHLADEDLSIVPRLAGREPALDNALARMHADHVEHEALVTELATLCEHVARDPRQLAASARRIAEVADRLTLVLEAHLSLEELVIFPALRLLPKTERDAIHAEMRDRREAALAAG